MNNGRWHPLVEFDYNEVDRSTPEPCLPISEYADALGKISRWLINDGSFQKPGVAVRAVALNYFLQPKYMGCETQKQLAKRLGISEERVGRVVNDFEKRFKFKVSSSYNTDL